MPDKMIIIIVSPFDHRSFDQLNMSNHGHSLPTRGTDPSFSHKSEVSITHEQNIICSKTLINRSRGKLSANDKRRKNPSNGSLAKTTATATTTPETKI